MQQFNSGNKIASPNNPWFVDNVYQGFSTESISETINLVLYEKDAAGTTVVVPLSSRRIFDRMGGKLGTYWGDESNLQYRTPAMDPKGKSESVISGVVLTDGTAAVAVYDATYDLEKIFESATKGRYVLKLTSKLGLAYYGWIEGVAVTSNVYTFTIMSEVGLSNQNWVKTWGSGIAGPYDRVEIYEYTTSVEVGDTDTFNEEMPYSENSTDYDQLKGLSDGQYRIDYRRGRFLGRKKDNDDTETITYIGLKSGEAAADVDVVKWGGVATAIDDGVFTPGTTTGIPIFGFADEASPDSVSEGDMGALRMTLDRKLITAGQHIEDAAHASGDYGTNMLAVRTDSQAALSGTTGDYTPLQTDAYGALRVAGGSSSVSSVYRASTNGNGDCTVAYTSGTTITIAGAPFTIQNEDLVYIKEVDATGNTATLWVNGASGVHMEISSNVITRSGGSDFSSNGVYEVGFNGQEKGYNAATQSKSVSESDPVDEHYVEEELIDTTNVTGSGTTYYPSSTGRALGNFNNFDVHIQTSGGVTTTIEAKIDDSTDWIDISKMGVDMNTGISGNVNWVDKNTIASFDDIHVRHIRVVSACSDETNGVQYHIKLVAL